MAEAPWNGFAKDLQRELVTNDRGVEGGKDKKAACHTSVSTAYEVIAWCEACKR